MIARIEQVTTNQHGELAVFATYWEGESQVNAQRLKTNIPLKKLVPVLDAEGRFVRLDGEPIPINPTANEQMLANQIGIQQEIVSTTGSEIAKVIVALARQFAAVHRSAAELLAQTTAASDAQLLSMASGRSVHWAQAVEVATANADAEGLAHSQARLALAQQAVSDAALARTLAGLEIAPRIAPLAYETPWPAGVADPRGYLAFPEVAALLGTEWEV